MTVSENPRWEPIRGALEACGLRTADSYLFDHPGSEFIGPQFRIRSCEMAYRLPEPGLMLLVLYRRLERRRSIGNPFADLFWFLSLVSQPRFGLHRIMGYIDTLEFADEKGLSEHRLALFYERIFNTGRTKYDGDVWLYRDVDDEFRALLRRVRHKATALPLDIEPKPASG